jgi:signal transduction histidine kinase
MRILLLLLLFFFVCPTSLFSQDTSDAKAFENALFKGSSVFMQETAFAKAHNFYIEKQWDSTLVYTAKQLSLPNTSSTLANYCHFFRGDAIGNKKIFKEAEKEFASITSDFPFYGKVKMYLGNTALELEEYTKALAIFEGMKSFSTQELFGIDKNNIEENIGLCYFHLGEYKKAEPYLLKSIPFQEQKKDTILLIGSYGNIASAYYEQYKDDEAIVYFTKAYNLSKEIKDFNSKVIAARNMSVVEENRKDYKKALDYRKEYGQWNDSLNNQAKIYEVAKSEKLIAVAQKQKEVSILQAENKIKVAERNGLLYSALVLLALLGTVVYFYKEKVKSNKIIVAQKEDLDQLNATKDKLFSIVSHDLRSSVNALKTSNTHLQNSVATKDTEQLGALLQTNSGIVNGAYNLLDNLLNWALLQTKQSYFEITPQKLFHTVEHVSFNYKALLTEKNISFENTVAKSEKVYADQESLKIVLRNLLDNAIKFSKPGGAIKIYTQHTRASFCDLVIEDTGLGMPEAKRLELMQDTFLLSKKEHEDIIGTGLGMQLCKSMITKNNGTLSIESELGKGTKMIVSLSQTPLNG